jgi:choline/glycine/proline betaine transport protein
MMKRQRATGMHLGTTLATLVILVGVLAAVVIDGSGFAAAVERARDGVAPVNRWLLPLLVAGFLGMMVWLGLGAHRRIRLGGDNTQPEFSTFAWLTMLFAAGTGVGLLFWGVAEPVLHHADNPFADGSSVLALRLSFFHWGLSGWAIFATTGLALAYSGFRRGRNLSVSAALEPLLGQWSRRWPGRVIDVVSVVATAIGICTTLGLGARQMNRGLDHLFGIGLGAGPQLLVVGTVTAVATVSVISGVARGVRILSEINIWLSVGLLCFFVVAGPSLGLAALAVESTGAYLQQLVGLSGFTGAEDGAEWHRQWTVFFWAWWFSWSPFVGMFIARISRGRTIGEYVLGVLLLPSVFTFCWITALGGGALRLIAEGGHGILQAVETDVATALFVTIEALPVPETLSFTASLVAVALIALYFVTSADSGTLVITTLLTEGRKQPSVMARAAWTPLLGALTAGLLLAGGIDALRSTVIMAGLPFSLVILLLAWALKRDLAGESTAPSQRGGHGERPREPWTAKSRKRQPSPRDQRDSDSEADE